MKVTLKKIKGEENGYIGTIVDIRHGRTNLLNFCYKNGKEITVIDPESRGHNYFTLEEFAFHYANREMQII